MAQRPEPCPTLSCSPPARPASSSEGQQAASGPSSVPSVSERNQGYSNQAFGSKNGEEDLWASSPSPQRSPRAPWSKSLPPRPPIEFQFAELAGEGQMLRIAHRLLTKSQHEMI